VRRYSDEALEQLDKGEKEMVSRWPGKIKEWEEIVVRTSKVLESCARNGIQC
jgi:hypothetical protein